MKHTLSSIDEAGKVVLDYKPVTLTTLTDEISAFHRPRGVLKIVIARKTVSFDEAIS